MILAKLARNQKLGTETAKEVLRKAIANAETDEMANFACLEIKKDLVKAEA